MKLVGQGRCRSPFGIHSNTDMVILSCKYLLSHFCELIIKGLSGSRNEIKLFSLFVCEFFVNENANANWGLLAL